LRVGIRIDGTTAQSALPTQQETAIEMSMENAQLEALDEELYSEVSLPRPLRRCADVQILSDVSRHPSGEVTPKLATMKMGGRDLVFELVSSFRSSPSSQLILVRCPRSPVLFRSISDV
jgi:hypothetical protein